MVGLSPQLRVLASAFPAISERASALVRGSGPDLLILQPGPGRWSAGECLQHLNLTARAYRPRFEAGLAELRRKELFGEGPFQMEWQARLLRYWLEPPSRLRVPTGSAFQPPAIKEPERLLPEFLEHQQAFLDFIDQSRGLALDRVKMTSPFAENVRYNLYSAFVLVAAHEGRHLWQAERTLEKLRSR